MAIQNCQSALQYSLGSKIGERWLSSILGREIILVRNLAVSPYPSTNLVILIGPSLRRPTFCSLHLASSSSCASPALFDLAHFRNCVTIAPLPDDFHLFQQELPAQAVTSNPFVLMSNSKIFVFK